MQKRTKNMAHVVLYTTPTCPDCRQLKAWMERSGIVYEERDLAEPEVMQEAKARYGVRVAPITVIGDWFTYGTYSEQRPRIAAALNLFEEERT